MKTFFLFLCVLAAVSVAPAATRTWSAAAPSPGSWHTATNWVEGAVPTSADDVILDNSSKSGSYTVQMTAAATCRTFTIGYAGNTNTILFLITGTASPAFSMAGEGTTADDFVIDVGGKVENAYTGSGTVFSIAGSTRFKNGGHYVHNTPRPFGTPFPEATFEAEADSTIEFGSLTGTLNVNLVDRIYGNLLLSGAKAFSSSATGSNFILGDLTIGPGASFSVTGTGAMTIDGNITNNGNASSFNAGPGGWKFNGNSTIAGAGTVTFSNGLTLQPGKSLTFSNTPVLNGGTSSIYGTLSCSASPITGNGSFSSESGCTMHVKHPLGLRSDATGQVQMTAGRTYSGSAAYVYNGSVAQDLGEALTAVNSLVIDNASGVTLSANFDVAVSLALNNGTLITGASSLSTLLDSTVITRTNGSVFGNLHRPVNFANTGPRLFPISTAAGYSGVDLNITSAGTGSGLVTITSVDSDNGNVDTATTLNRYWDINAAGTPSGFTASLTFNYLAGDVRGNEANYIAGRHLSANLWQKFPATTVNTVEHSAKVDGVTGFSSWSLGEQQGLPVSLSSFNIE